MNNKIQKKATVWFTVCNFIVKGISFITIPLFTRLLSPFEYGTMSVYYSYEQFFLIVATLELSLGAYQRGILKYKNDIRLFTSSLIVLSMLITSLIGLVIVLNINYIDNLLQVTAQTTLWMIVYFLFQPSYTCWQNYQRFKYKYKSVVVSTIAYTLLSTLAALAGIIFISPTSNSRIVSSLIVQSLFCLPFVFKLVDIKMMVNSKNKVIDMWKFCLNFQWPLVFHSLSYLVLGQSDKVMISQLVGPSEAGLYSVAYTLSNVAIIFQTAINQAYKPWRYQTIENGQLSKISKATISQLVVLLVVITGFILLMPEIISILFTRYYYHCLQIIPPITIGVYFMFLYTVFADVESYFGKTKYIMLVSVVCAIINIIGNYIGIKNYGYESCAYVTLFSYVLFSFLHYLFMLKTIKQNSFKQSDFPIKTICFISIVALLIVPLSLMLYEFQYIRFVIFIMIIVYISHKYNLVKH